MIVRLCTLPGGSQTGVQHIVWRKALAISRRQVVLRAASQEAEYDFGRLRDARRRNRDLQHRLKSLLGEDAEQLRSLKAVTQKYRDGQIQAGAVYDHFSRALGSTWEVSDVLLELARLLPDDSQAQQLIEAATTAGWSSEEPEALAEALSQASADTSAPDLLSTNAWQPLDRSSISAAAEEIARSQEAMRTARMAAGSAAAGVAGVDAEVAEDVMGLANSRSALMAGGQPRGAQAAKRQRSCNATTADVGPAPGGGASGVLVWVRQDMRLHDNAPLVEAAAAAKKAGGQVTLVHVHSPEEDGDDYQTGVSWRPAGANLAWQQAALRALDADLQALYGPGAGLVFRRGPYLDALLAVAKTAGAGAVHFSRRYEPAMRATDERVAAGLRAAGLRPREFQTYLLYDPEDVRINMGGRWTGHFGTLMPFVRACEKLPGLGRPLPAPGALPTAAVHPSEACGGCALGDLGLAPLPVRADGSVVDWTASIERDWDISEAGALALLDDFLSNGLRNYESARQYADGRAVSRLSAYLHWGMLSARRFDAEARARGGKELSKTFSRRLAWRDLAYWQLHHWPDMAAVPMRRHYATQAWRDDPAALRAWQRGRTGFPLVDAGMRQLWAVGWMQQSVRMVCAAFLTEYLSIHWVHGARWFHWCLVDGDLAINSMMWQNAGKSGLDQWNFTLLPTSSSQDPDGAYIGKWVPELAKLPKKWRYVPWAAPPEVLAAAEVVLGTTYPQRITTENMQELRKANATAIREARRQAPEWRDRGDYDVVVVPSGATVGHNGQKMRVFTKADYRDV